MKKGWEVKRLGEVCEFKPSKNEARNKLPPSAYVSFMPMEDLKIDVKFPEAKKNKMLSDVIGGYTYFADGDVLLAKITPCFENGKLGIANALTNGIGFGSSEFIVMRPSEDLLNEWLYYFLSQESFRQEGAQRMGGAVGHKRLQKNFVEKSPIPLPPLPEQHRIVALLDEAFAQLTLAEAHAAQNLQNARALFESHLHQTFSHPGSDWVEKKLGEVCEYDKVQGIHKNLPYVGLEHIESNTAKFIGSHEPYAVKSMTFRFSTNHVLYGRLRPYLNKALSPNFDGHCSTEIFPLKPGKGLSREYLLYWLLCDSTCEQINATCTGTRMPRAQMNKVLGFFFPLPPLPEQRRIVAQLDALSAEVRKLEELYTRKQTLLAELKRSLLHHAFTGNL